MRFSIAAALIFLATTLGVGVPQSPFVGQWLTRISRDTNRPAFTVLIVELGQRLGGAVVLLNPDASEAKLPILNVKITENVLEFETRDTNGILFWRLTLGKDHSRGQLHGSGLETIVDEPVSKQL